LEFAEYVCKNLKSYMDKLERSSSINSESNYTEGSVKSEDISQEKKAEIHSNLNIKKHIMHSMINTQTKIDTPG